MKKLVIIVWSMLAALCAFGQASAVRQLAPDVYYYFGDELRHRSANCVWVVLKDYVVVVDANYPWAAKEILDEIRKTTTKPVRFVVNTHYHHDHSFGNGVFAETGAVIVATSRTADEMKSLGRREWTQNYSGQPLDGYTQVFPSMTFDSTLVFDDGNHRIELIRMGPAHTSGDTVVYLPSEKILITGDLFVNGNPWGNNVADPNSDYDRWLKVLDTLISWNAKVVIPGHGEPAISATLTTQRAYLADMLDQVRRFIKTGKTVDETVKAVNLERYQGYGSNQTSTDRSVRAMYNHLSRRK